MLRSLSLGAFPNFNPASYVDFGIMNAFSLSFPSAHIVFTNVEPLPIWKLCPEINQTCESQRFCLCSMLILYLLSCLRDGGHDGNIWDFLKMFKHLVFKESKSFSHYSDFYKNLHTFYYSN